MRKIHLILFALLLTAGITTTAHALTVSPAKIEITADPGQTVQGEIELFNEQEESKTFYASYENFESRGDSGAPYFIGAEDGLATWILTDSEVTLRPGERVQVPYRITIPNNARPGGYFAAIFFGNEPPQGMQGGEVSVGGKIGILVLLRVSGNVEESAGLANFGSENKGYFFSLLPIVFEFEFNNTGGDWVVPRGEIEVKNTFQRTSATLIANDHEGSVLPNSARRFEVVWGNQSDEAEKKGFFETAFAQLIDFHFGWYTANIDLSWGESIQSADASFQFFMIPWQLFSILFIILAVPACLFRVWVSRLKRRILAEAMLNRS